jgi:hypothetical protein
MAELAQCLGVEKAALTGLVDRVERRGLAKRTTVHGDRRELHVMLTDAGQRGADVPQAAALSRTYPRCSSRICVGKEPRP